MPIIKRVSAASVGGQMLPAGNPRVSAVRAQAEVESALVRSANVQIRRIMASAGVDRLGDGDKFLPAQVARMLENKTPSERIMIKNTLITFGLYPRDVGQVF